MEICLYHTYIIRITPIPYEEAILLEGRHLSINEEWGETWGCAWFRFEGIVPERAKDKEVGALLDVDGEGCVFVDGTPYVGITNKVHWDIRSAKSFVPLYGKALGNEEISILMEAGANGLFGAGQKDYRLKQADIVEINRKAMQLYYDCFVLFDLAKALPERTPRRNKILHGLNQIANIWQEGKGLSQALIISKQLPEVNQPIKVLWMCTQ